MTTGTLATCTTTAIGTEDVTDTIPRTRRGGSLLSSGSGSSESARTSRISVSNPLELYERSVLQGSSEVSVSARIRNDDVVVKMCALRVV
jgi:hypothetical protein